MQNMNYKPLDLPPVSQMLRDAGMEPKKQLGQNFLFDLNLTRKIACSVPDIENSVVLEIGPGPGGLTRALLDAGARKVIAVEKDSTALPILEKIRDAANGRLEIILGDALRISNEQLAISNNDHLVICANLPYNVGTELLIGWLHLIANCSLLIPNSMTLMFQREVAERIVAKVGDKQYGRLAVLTALTANAKILFNVPNTAFVPAPKVQSAVVQIIPKRSAIGNYQLAAVEKLTAKLFGQRRKMIRGILPDVNWGEFGLSGTERAEELSPETYQEIASKIMV
ncbi:MAG: 16S rRNA (adenine(1518)-N(6)/adenine(1519)-N(6))-dimethyltransferase RsmA [Rickettsiales bacterium]|jgi:16S rRNA (adenine1518-N6/adenine1519-N6)-dimethyltransferase|nr:16S rRNA (adenine(1518)-N(6)/adenine(1519)-N(6))-dimethyltransferase RsmA [Rickettsiales bacterium]